MASALPLLLYKLSLWKEGCIINSISSDDFMALYIGSIRVIKVCKTNLFTNRFGSCMHSFGQVWDALVRCVFTYKLPLLLTMNFNPSMSYSNSPKCPFMTSDRCCDLHVMYTDDICKRLEKAELNQKMAFSNAAGFDMAAFPLIPELKFV